MKNLAGMRRTARAWLMDEGANIAIETAMGICRDEYAPADARAACADILLRAAGMYHPLYEEDDHDDDQDAYADRLARMTPEETQEEMRRVEALIDTLRKGADGA